MDDQWLVVFQVGPGVAGPFPGREAAESWAERYSAEYRAMNGPHTLAWIVEPLLAPANLEWWT